jgi:hypothetical protein
VDVLLIDEIRCAMNVDEHSPFRKLRLDRRDREVDSTMVFAIERGSRFRLERTLGPSIRVDERRWNRAITIDGTAPVMLRTASLKPSAMTRVETSARFVARPQPDC